MEAFQLQTHSAAETQDWARQLAKKLPPGTVLCLHGDLGTGKTCFTQGIAQGLGITRSVGSPTFTLINEYPGTPPLAHIDLYRIYGEADAWSLGLEDYLFSAEFIMVVEWAERAPELIPEHAWHIRFSMGEADTSRILHITPPTREQERPMSPFRWNRL